MDHTGSNLRELEDRFETATDWREHFEARPWLMLAVRLPPALLDTAPPVQQPGVRPGCSSTPSI